MRTVETLHRDATGPSVLDVAEAPVRGDRAGGRVAVEDGTESPVAGSYVTPTCRRRSRRRARAVQARGVRATRVCVGDVADAAVPREPSGRGVATEDRDGVVDCRRLVDRRAVGADRHVARGSQALDPWHSRRSGSRHRGSSPPGDGTGRGVPMKDGERIALAGSDVDDAPPALSAMPRAPFSPATRVQPSAASPRRAGSRPMSAPPSADRGRRSSACRRRRRRHRSACRRR